MKTKQLIVPVAILSGAFIAAPQAQVVREDGVKSIAGVLIPGTGPQATAEWTFKSAGGEVLFASLDGDIYRKSMGGHETVLAAEPGGCEGEGGPGIFYLSVLSVQDGISTEICKAERPAPPPGWQRDPRLACELPKTAAPVTYTIQVGLKGEGENLQQSSYPFVLNVSLRGIAPSNVNIQSAIAQSGNKF